MPDEKDLATIIGEGVAICMRQRTAHRAAEVNLDEWFKTLPADKEARLVALKQAREQIETARQAMEALYSRFRSLAVTARN